MRRPRCAEVTGLTTDTPVVFPEAQERLDGLLAAGADAFYHYNTLRPLSLKRRHAGKGPVEPSSVRHDVLRPPEDFHKDPRWKNLARRDAEKRAIVLVASKRTIMRRMLERRTVEPNAPPEGPGKDDGKEEERESYRRLRWLNVLRRVDLAALYRAWCDELRARGVPYVILNSEDDAYRTVEDEDDLPGIAGDEPEYSEPEVRGFLKRRSFEYQRVELPYGLHTGGQDRRETRDLVLPESLSGKTVLDVGCALGYFSFEAEARGATRVVGVEVKEERLNDATLLGRIKGSSVEFVLRDVVSDPPEETFDHVLLLNVIHHLTEPVRAMRQLASITNERLVVEFPTFKDKKFRKGAKVRLPFLYDRLPLIGVSSTARGVGQTFVFTPPAIKRIFLDHEPLFESVEFVRSPMPGRMIALCHKGTHSGVNKG